MPCLNRLFQSFLVSVLANIDDAKTVGPLSSCLKRPPYAVRQRTQADRRLQNILLREVLATTAYDI